MHISYICLSCSDCGIHSLVTEDPKAAEFDKEALLMNQAQAMGQMGQHPNPNQAMPQQQMQGMTPQQMQQMGMMPQQMQMQPQGQGQGQGMAPQQMNMQGQGVGMMGPQQIEMQGMANQHQNMQGGMAPPMYGSAQQNSQQAPASYGNQFSEENVTEVQSPLHSAYQI